MAKMASNIMMKIRQNNATILVLGTVKSTNMLMICEKVSKYFKKKFKGKSYI